MSTKILAGLFAGIALAVGFTVYMLVRGKAFVNLVTSDESMQSMSPKVWFYIFLGAFIIAALGFGAFSGLVYHWLGSRVLFTGIALGAALLLSLLALMSKTPMPWDKVAMNFMVGGLLGVLTPLFAAI
jgi:hypothetical protein